MLAAAAALLGAAACALSARAFPDTAAIAIEDVKRTAYVSGSVLREEAHLRVRNLSATAVSEIVVAVPAGLWARRMSHVRAARPEDRSSLLAVRTLPRDACLETLSANAAEPYVPRTTTADEHYEARCFGIALPETLEPDAAASVLVGMSYGRVASPSPSRGIQTGAMSFVFPLLTVLYTPHVVSGPQTLDIVVSPDLRADFVQCPAPSPLFAAPPRDAPTDADAAPRSSFTCGPYPPSYAPKRSRIRVTQRKHMPWAHAARVERTLSVNVAGRTVSVCDVYTGIQSDGFRLADAASFSRIEWLMAVRKDPASMAVFPVVPLIVPAAAGTVVARDDLGYLTTTLRRRTLARAPDTAHVVDVQPRYPLAFGWATPLTLEYSLPLASIADVRAAPLGVHLRLRVPFPMLYHDWIADDVDVRVVLPGGARLPVPAGNGAPEDTRQDAAAIHLSDKIGPVHTQGTRPAPMRTGSLQVHSLRVSNFGREHEGAATVDVFVSWLALLRPHIAVVACLLLSAGVYVLRARPKTE